MNPIDEIKLTAYALGEGSAADRAEIEARLRTDPAAQAAVDEIRALAAQLETELKGEPAPARTTSGSTDSSTRTPSAAHTCPR